MDEFGLCKRYDDCERMVENEDIQCPENYLSQPPRESHSESIKCFNNIKDNLIPELKELEASLHQVAVKCLSEIIVNDSLALARDELAWCNKLGKDLLKPSREKRATDGLCFQVNNIEIKCVPFRHCCMPLT
uniref:DUF19 domain-containing protein n=1 Tax=Syphacia muris TaxID=451379 RepID=A0A0N5AC91_9BILA